MALPRPEIQPRVVSGSVSLWQQGSALEFMAPNTTKIHEDAWHLYATWDNIGGKESWCCQCYNELDYLSCCMGHGDITAWVDDDSHVWVYFPLAVFCVDICDLYYDRRTWEPLNQGPGWFCPAFCWPWEKGPCPYWTLQQKSWLGTTWERWPLYSVELAPTLATSMRELVQIACAQANWLYPAPEGGLTKSNTTTLTSRALGCFDHKTKISFIN